MHDFSNTFFLLPFTAVSVSWMQHHFFSFFLIHNLWQLLSQLVIQLFYVHVVAGAMCVCDIVPMFHDDDKIVANYLYKCSDNV